MLLCKKYIEILLHFRIGQVNKLFCIQTQILVQGNKTLKLAFHDPFPALQRNTGHFEWHGPANNKAPWHNQPCEP